MVFKGSRFVFHGSNWVFQCFGLAFRGSRWVLRVYNGSRSVFHGSRWFFMFFMAPGLVFMIPGGFLWSLMVPGWFESELSAAGTK